MISLILLLFTSCNKELKLTQDKLNKEKKTVEDLQKKVGDMMKSTQEMEGQLAALTLETNGLKTENESFLELMAEKDIETGSLRDSINEKNKLLEGEITKKESLNQEIASLTQNLSEAMARITGLTNELNAAKTAPPSVAAVPAPTSAPPATGVAPSGPTAALSNPVIISAPPQTANSPNPLTTPDAGRAADLIIKVQLVAGGKNYPIPNCKLYVTEMKPQISKWGLYLKNPQVSINQLQAIQTSLKQSIIHKMATTNEGGEVTISGLEAGIYFISGAHPVTQNGVQWSKQHILKPGQNVLLLSNNDLQ